MNNHLLRAALWLILALVLGLVALVAEAEKPRRLSESLPKAPAAKFTPSRPIKAHYESLRMD